MHESSIPFESEHVIVHIETKKIMCQGFITNGKFVVGKKKVRLFCEANLHRKDAVCAEITQRISISANLCVLCVSAVNPFAYPQPYSFSAINFVKNQRRTSPVI